MKISFPHNGYNYCVALLLVYCLFACRTTTTATLFRSSRAHASVVVVAQAFSTRTVSSHHHRRRRSGIVNNKASKSSSSSPAVVRLYLARINGDRSNSNSNNPFQDDNSGSPQTGWNHNLPDENSKFWQGGVEERQADDEDTSKGGGSSSKGGRRRLKTGWLHNTQSRQEIERKKKVQQAKKATTGAVEGSTTTTTSNTTPARRLLELAMKQKERNHRVVAPVTFHPCGNDMGVIAVTEHKVSVPLVRGDKNESSEKDNNNNQRRRIDVFFQIAEKVTSEAHREWLMALQNLSPDKRATAYVEKAGMRTADKMILYLQGGPGFGAPTPVVSLGLASKGSSWAAQALSSGNYERVVLMDQRGTGKSTTMTKQSLEKLFPDLFLLDDNENTGSTSLDDFAETKPDQYAKVKQAVDEVVQYMSQFRADNIVWDAEDIRDTLLLPVNDESSSENIRPWGACLGQSFGGFCIMTYLSLVANPPKICLLTGGIGPALHDAYDVYRKLWPRVKERTLLYYDMYPGDVKLVKKIVQRLLQKPEPLPSGGTLTARRFLQLGIAFGGSPSSFASMHTLLQSALLQGTEEDDMPEFNRSFLKEIEMNQSYDDAPIYFWLHESIYADGKTFSPTNWAAHRSYKNLVAQDESFDYRKTSDPNSNEPVIFFGEMTFPWMAEDYGELKGVGLSRVVEGIANKEDWPSLYDPDHMKEILNSGKTRAAAAAYIDDMYVDFDICRTLTSRGGPLEKCKVWFTNDYQHSGLRDDGANIFQKIHGMTTGSIRTPS